MTVLNGSGGNRYDVLVRFATRLYRLSSELRTTRVAHQHCKQPVLCPETAKINDKNWGILYFGSIHSTIRILWRMDRQTALLYAHLSNVGLLLVCVGILVLWPVQAGEVSVMTFKGEGKYGESWKYWTAV